MTTASPARQELRRRRRRQRTGDAIVVDDDGTESDAWKENRFSERAAEGDHHVVKPNEEDEVDDDAGRRHHGAPARALAAAASQLPLDRQPQEQDDSDELTFRVAKWAILRLLGIVYLVAFLGAHYQNEGLMGRHGLVPATDVIGSVLGRQEEPSVVHGFLRHPTVLYWFVPLTDASLSVLYRVGIVLSGMVVVAGINSWLLQFLLWLSYLSVVTVTQLLAPSGGSFYSYGWESQLLETGFLAIFLCQLPSLDGRRKRRIDLALYERGDPATTPDKAAASSSHSPPQPPSPVVRWLFCWLMFRISVGAGLIKVRGSSCWKDKTCLHYHFETQPIPSPISFVFHFLPPAIQSTMVDVDLWVQLYTSELVLMPVELVPSNRRNLKRFATALLRLGGVLQVGFMVGILLSGNFAFLNHLTIIPGLECLDDKFVPKFLLDHVVKGKQHKDGLSKTIDDNPTPAPAPSLQHRRWLRPSRSWVDVALLSLIVFLSWPVVANLLQLKGSRQVMNASFDSFHIVNTYGAFGSVGQARYEAIVQVHNGTNWIEIELPCKPGNVRRRPCFCAPYHYRLDWNIWFLGFKPHQAMLRQRESWMFSLLVKLLSSGGPQQPRPWLNLLDAQSANFLTTQFYDRYSAPLQVKVDMYHYQMNKPLWSLLHDLWSGKDVVWWKRRFEESLIPPVMLDATGSRLQLAPTD